MESVELAGQTLLVALLAGWLVLGLVENLRAPGVNRDTVADVMSMEQMREAWPEIYARLSRNRVTDPRVHRLVFGGIVVAEAVVSAVLVAAVLALAGAVLGLVGAGAARALGAAASLGFTAIWGGFLVGGQWFGYWVAHDGAQKTHFLLTLWGIATFIALT